MVGDGLNDAPALAGAYVSASPASAVDISRTAADAIFQGEHLRPVLELLEVAGRAARLIRQNFALALAYNVVTVPLAVLGLVTPLVAALCMSASSLIVVGNALRLGRSR
jgi:Cu2+-exporting ATPase